jgi:Family of unknown function (DUF6788)
MSSVQPSLVQLEAQRDRLKLDFAALNDFRPGSLVARYRKCGKPNCHCAQPNAKGHGPSFSLTHSVERKTLTKIIPSAFVEQTRAQLTEHQRFRQLARDLVTVNEQICNARMRTGESASDAKTNSTHRQLGRRNRR